MLLLLSPPYCAASRWQAHATRRPLPMPHPRRPSRVARAARRACPRIHVCAAAGARAPARPRRRHRNPTARCQTPSHPRVDKGAASGHESLPTTPATRSPATALPLLLLARPRLRRICAARLRGPQASRAPCAPRTPLRAARGRLMTAAAAAGARARPRPRPTAPYKWLPCCSARSRRTPRVSAHRAPRAHGACTPFRRGAWRQFARCLRCGLECC